jgi:hypothetical protein
MPVSKNCDHCDKVKRCKLYARHDVDKPARTHEDYTYLCTACARELQYTKEN